MKLWTLKEAYVKAVGRGISAAPGLKGFSFSLHPSNSHGPRQSIAFSTVDQADAGKWDFALMQPTAEHLGAVCCGRGAVNEPLQLKTFMLGPLAEDSSWAQGHHSPVLAMGSSD